MPRGRVKVKQKIDIDSIKHQDTRKNIPTEELRNFVKEEGPKTLLYPRDPSLDPQLVWKGKDEQDSKDLAVPSTPIYIQEKIHPQVIIEDLLKEYEKSHNLPKKTIQLDLFADFNGLPKEFDKRVDFYKHDQHWSNRMILGDSLLVMASLAEKESLKGQVQMIYIDPPYGIKFGSNWQVSTRSNKVPEGKNEGTTRQPEQIRAFRDTWEFGIHSYLTYLRDRLTISRELLTISGSIFVQIGQDNVHLVRSLLDEVFGSENCCGEIVFVKTSGLSQTLLPDRCDYILWYAKDIKQVKYRQLYQKKSIQDGTASTYSWLELPDGSRRGMNKIEKEHPENIGANYKIYKPDNITSQGNPTVPFCYNGKQYAQAWKTNSIGLQRLARSNRLHVAENSLQYVRYITDFPGIPITKLWTDTATGNFTEEKIYVVQTGTKTIERCLLMTTDPGDLVLDPTCGSGTTSFVAEQWGRRWITIDTSRVALALARTRLMAARFPYYILADSPEGLKVKAEIAGMEIPRLSTRWDIRKGFVYTDVPHIMLKSITNNDEIDTIYEKWQIIIEEVNSKIRNLTGSCYEDWEIPIESDDVKVNVLIKKRWELRQQCQKEIDASIAHRADTEPLYDEPYEDKKRVRVTGPFTVESLSPHRVLPADVNFDGSISYEEGEKEQHFISSILENLRKAGVQNTKKNEKISFDSLDVYAGEWIQAEGRYTDAEGKPRRAAVTIGPQFGTVGPELIRNAVMEAVKGIGFDMLLICGFAFDPHVSEEVKNYGKITVLPVKMNPDLTMGDELLKKTGTGNLFMVFGEPDLKIVNNPDDTITVELRGLDIYDPTTGAIRNSSPDEIACWFIDTDYNGEAFFVRQAYFTGADRPYDALKRTLRAEVDESVWESIYGAISRPFQIPSGGKIAIKVINHYGDEVLKVYDLNKTQ